jgi:hypothetical protein
VTRPSSSFVVVRRRSSSCGDSRRRRRPSVGLPRRIAPQAGLSVAAALLSSPADRPALLLPRSTMRNLLATAVLLATVCVPAAAQTRTFPEQVELGRLTLRVFPDALLDGKAVRLGPGARIHDESNRVLMPGGVAGEKRVAYARGAMGEIVRVWILTPAEHDALAARLAEARRSGAGNRN